MPSISPLRGPGLEGPALGEGNDRREPNPGGGTGLPPPAAAPQPPNRFNRAW